MLGENLGLAGGCDSGTMGGGAVVNGMVIGMTVDVVVTRGVTGGKELVTGMLG